MKNLIEKFLIGFINKNRDVEQNSLTLEEVQDLIKKNKEIILLDVRSPQEYNEKHLNGAILIPTYELESTANKILKDKNQIIIVYCKSGTRSKKAIKMLKKLEYENLYSLRNGLDAYNYRKKWN